MTDANVKAGKNALKAELSQNMELGLKSLNDWGKVELKIYKSKLKDAVKYNGSNWPLDYYENDGIVNIQGVELVLDTELMGWDLDSSLNFNKAIAKSTDLQKGRRPNRTMSLNLSKSSGKGNRDIKWTARSCAWDKDNNSSGEHGGDGLRNLRTSYDFTEHGVCLCAWNI